MISSQSRPWMAMPRMMKISQITSSSPSRASICVLLASGGPPPAPCRCRAPGARCLRGHLTAAPGGHRPGTRRERYQRPKVSLAASLRFSLACLTWPLAWSALPSASHCSLPAALPAASFALPLTSSALFLIVSSVLTCPAPPPERSGGHCEAGIFLHDAVRLCRLGRDSAGRLGSGLNAVKGDVPVVTAAGIGLAVPPGHASCPSPLLAPSRSSLLSHVSVYIPGTGRQET